VKERTGDRLPSHLWKAGLCLLAVCFACVGQAGADEKDPASRPAWKFTVATYNINYGNFDLKLAAETILKSGADIVAIQETTAEQARHFRMHLRKTYKHMRFRTGKWADGFGFMSKVPLARLTYIPKKHGHFGTWLAEVVLDGKTVQLANIHLYPTIPGKGDKLLDIVKLVSATENVRTREIARICQKVSRKLPVILLGDFNSPPYLNVRKYLVDRKYTDSFAAVAPNGPRQHTWRTKWRGTVWKQTLDYVYHTPQVRTLASRIINSDASDHDLLVSELTWAPKKAAGATTQPAGAPGRAGR